MWDQHASRTDVKKRNSTHRRASKLKTNLIEKNNWTFQIDFPPHEEDTLQFEESMKEMSSTEKRRKIINSLSTVKDAID